MPIRSSRFRIVVGSLCLSALTALIANSRISDSVSTFTGVIIAIERSGHIDLVTIEDNRVVSTDARDVPAFGDTGFQRSLTLSNSGDSLFVLIPGHVSTPSQTKEHDSVLSHGELLTIDTRTRQVRRLVTLPDDHEYSFASVGHTTGDVWLFSSDGQQVLVIDPERGRTNATFEIAKDPHYNWDLADAAVSDDERRIYVSYHGGCNPWSGPRCTAGIDWYDRNDPGPLVRCSPHANPSLGCIVSHGQFALLSDRVVAATGHEQVRTFDLNGHLLTEYHSDLDGHVMSLAVTPDKSMLVVSAPCQARGLSVLAFGEPDRSPLASNAEACGDRIAVTSDGKWAVLTGAAPSLTAYTHGVVVASLVSGAVAVRVTLSGEVVDALPVSVNLR